MKVTKIYAKIFAGVAILSISAPMLARETKATNKTQLMRGSVTINLYKKGTRPLKSAERPTKLRVWKNSHQHVEDFKIEANGKVEIPAYLAQAYYASVMRAGARPIEESNLVLISDLVEGKCGALQVLRGSGRDAFAKYEFKMCNEGTGRDSGKTTSAVVDLID